MLDPLRPFRPLRLGAGSAGGALSGFVQDDVAPSLILDFRRGIYASDDTGSWAQSRAQDGVRPSLVLDFVTPQYGSA